MVGRTMQGHVHLAFGDVWRATWTPRARNVFFGTALAVAAINLVQSRDAIFEDGNMIVGLLALISTIAIFSLIVPAIILLNVALCYRRMRHGHLDITYEIDPEMQVISDESGIRINLPWTLVKSAYEDRHAFRLNLKPGGQRYYPKRAFSESDVTGIRDLLHEKLGGKAKLKC